MSSDTVRRATAAEVVDPRWRVLRPGRPRDTAVFPGDDDPLTRHWVVQHDGAVVGCVTVMAQPWPDGSGPAWRLRGMAVDGHLQRTGLGHKLLLAVHDEVAEPMWCDARLLAVPFYAGAGWEVRSPEFLIEGIGPHHRMIWSGPA